MWKQLKYKTRNIFKTFTKEAAHSNKTESPALETKLKILEPKIRWRGNPEYIDCKEELDKTYQVKTDSAIIRNRCDWYEHRKNIFNKFEKTLCCSKSNKVRKKITDEKRNKY